MMRLAALVGATVALAIVADLTPLSDRLFAFHMTQHLLLIAIAAPLLVLGGLQWQKRPALAWSLFVGVFLLWHWPPLFQWAARQGWTALELVTILGTAWLFWSVALGKSALNYGARALFVVTASVVTDLPGVVMLFAPHAFCTMPSENAAAFGLTPLQDQQIAGLLMWVPANLAFFGIATALFAQWLRASHPSSAVSS